MFLLDTEILFELSKAKAGGTDPGLIAWAAGVSPQNLFISALALLELEEGAGRLARRDKATAAALRAWLEGPVLRAFDCRVLAVDAAVAGRRAGLSIGDPRDALIAATALEHGLTLATRDRGAFKGARVKLFNPWGYSPEVKDDGGDWRQAGRGSPLWLRNLFVRA